MIFIFFQKILQKSFQAVDNAEKVPYLEEEVKEGKIND